MTNRTTLSLSEAILTYKPIIQRALDKGGNTYDIDALIQGTLNGRFRFYVTPDGESFAFMELVNYPLARAYHWFIGGGSTEGLLSLQPSIASDAIQLECDRLTMTGRKGFARALKSTGWKETHVHMELALPIREGIQDARADWFYETDSDYAH